MEDAAFEDAAMEIALQHRMMHREQLGGNQAADFGAELDVVSLGDAALERLALERARLLLEPSDHPRQLTEFLVACQASAELQACAGGDSATLSELTAEIVTVFGSAVDLVGELGGLELHPLERALIAALELSFELPGLLLEPRLRDFCRALGRLGHLPDFLCGLIVGRRLAFFWFGDLVGVLHRLRARLEVFLLPREVKEVGHLVAVDEALGLHHLERMLAHHERGDRGFVLLECGSRSQRLKRRRRDELIQDRAVERGGEANVVGLAHHWVHLEQGEEQVIHQRAEMRDETLAGFGEVGNGGSIGDDFLPGAAIVAVALEP